MVGVNRRLRLIIFGLCLLAPGTTSCSGTAEEPNPATPQATAATSATPSEPIQEASPGSPTQSAKTPGDAAPTPTVTTPEPVDCRVANCVALTYDDGPSPLTNQLLDTFESRQAVATLFLNGQYVDGNPNPILRAKQLGMEIKTTPPAIPTYLNWLPKPSTSRSPIPSSAFRPSPVAIRRCCVHPMENAMCWLTRSPATTDWP